MKAVVWGCGGSGKDFLRKKIMNHNYEILCFTDSNSSYWGKRFEGKYEIIPPEKIEDLSFDVIIVCSIYSDDIRNTLTNDHGVDGSRIITYGDINKSICGSIAEKYKDDKDPEIQEVVKEFRNGTPHVLGAYVCDETDVYAVHRDDDGLPFIVFEGKRMYFPREYTFDKYDGNEIVKDILIEQGEGSPHLYIPLNESIPDNAVIVDAGVCEGNFSLRYVEKAGYVYLVESDPMWWEPLERTFKPYEDKVEICKKNLSGRDNSSEIRLDTLVRGKLDFLKMDIEGSEVYSLLGAENTLKNNNVKCAICSYHRQYDEKYIELILNSYGYKVSFSHGYMFFSFDEYMHETMDLRRGVVYARKQ